MISFIVIAVGILVAFAFGRFTAQQEMAERLNEVLTEFKKTYPEMFEDE